MNDQMKAFCALFAAAEKLARYWLTENNLTTGYCAIVCFGYYPSDDKYQAWIEVSKDVQDGDGDEFFIVTGFCSDVFEDKTDALSDLVYTMTCIKGSLARK